MAKTLCTACSEGPSGERGHIALEYHVEGPFPGHHIFRCTACDERWIRHYGSISERYAWTRYSQLFAMRIPRADPPKPKVSN